VGEIIHKLQTLPDVAPYNLWSCKLQQAMGDALAAYRAWVLSMVEGCSTSLTQPCLAENLMLSLGITLPRALCEVTSKALMAALELPFLYTSFETFKHVRDRLLAAQQLAQHQAHRQSQQSGMLGWGDASVAQQCHQKRLDCLNTLLYLRALSAVESSLTHPEQQLLLEAGGPLQLPFLPVLPTTLAEEVLGLFTDVYRTIHALGFEEATSFHTVVAVVKALEMAGAHHPAHHPPNPQMQRDQGGGQGREGGGKGGSFQYGLLGGGQEGQQQQQLFQPRRLGTGV
jgi:hypothetical protein